MTEIPFKVSRVRLDLKSLAIVAALIGFFAGLTAIVIATFVALFHISTLQIGDGIGMLVLAPVISAASSAFSALLAYPLYRWSVNRYFSHAVSGVKAE